MQSRSHHQNAFNFSRLYIPSLLTRNAINGMRATKTTPTKSRRPESTPCRGISVNGQPCRRAVSANGIMDENGNQYCHSHRAQAVNKDIYNIRASKEVPSSDSEDDKDHQEFRPGDDDADDADDNSDVVFLNDTESESDPLEQLTKNMQTLGLATPRRPAPSSAVGFRQDTVIERSATVNISSNSTQQSNTTVIVIYSSDSTPEITINGNQQGRLISSDLSSVRRLEIENTSSTSSQRLPLSNDKYSIRAPDPIDFHSDNPFISSQSPSNSNININKPLPATPPAPQSPFRHSIPLLPQSREPSPTSSTSPSSSTASSSPNTQKRTTSPFSVVNRHHISPSSDNSDTSSIKGFVSNLKSIWHQPWKHQSTIVSHASSPYEPSPSGSSIQPPPHPISRSTDPTPLPDSLSPYAAAAARESQLRTHSTPTLPTPALPMPSLPARDRARSTTPLGTPGISVQCKGVVRRNGKQCTNRVKVGEGGEEGALPYCHHHRPEGVREKLVFVDPKVTLKWVHVDDWINKNLSERTQQLLRVEMERPISQSDEAGFIYAYHFVDDQSSSTDTYSLYKVGRTTNIHRRMYQWNQKCGYTPKLIECFPSSVSSPPETPRRGEGAGGVGGEAGGRRRANVLAPSPSSSSSSSCSSSSSSSLQRRGATAPKCKYSHRAERLIHIELSEKHRADVHICKGCNNVHREWFKVEKKAGAVLGDDGARTRGVKGKARLVQPDREGWEDIRPVIVWWINYIETVYGVA